MAQFFYPTIEQLVRARVRPDGRQGIARFLAETREAVPRGIVEGQQAYTAEHVTTPRAFREQLVRQGYVPYRVAEDGTEQLLDTEQFRRWYMDGGDEPLKRIEQMAAPRPRDQEIVATFYEREKEPYYTYIDPTTGERKRDTSLPTIQGYRWRVVQADQDGGARGGAAAPKYESMLAVRDRARRQLTGIVPEAITPANTPREYLDLERSVLEIAKTANVRPENFQEQQKRVTELETIKGVVDRAFGGTPEQQKASRNAYSTPDAFAEYLAGKIRIARKYPLTSDEREFLRGYARVLWGAQ